MLWRFGQKTEEAVKLKTVVSRSFQAGLTGEEWRPKSIVSFTASGPRCGASGPWTSPPAPDQPWSRLPRALLPSSGLRVPSALPFPPVSALRSGASAALPASLPAVSVSLGADVDRVLVPLSLPLSSVLALLLGPQHHVGEEHEHLEGQWWKRVTFRVQLTRL